MAITYENAVLVEIREKDYAQKYEYPTEDGGTGCMWFTGWERAQGVKVGDKGKLVYRTGPSYGLYFFEKYE